ncbi:hypothetical protein Tco_0237303 [Tanacetum coccineum]
MAVQTIFNQMEVAVQQYHVDKQCFEIQKKQFLIENDRLLDQIISQYIVNIVVNSSMDINTYVNVISSIAMNDSVEIRNKFLKLEAELIKQHNMVEKDDLKAELQAKDTTIKKLKANIKRLNKTSTTNSVKKNIDEIETINIELEHRAKEHVESLVNQLNQKSVEITDLNAQLQEKYVKLVQELLGYVRDTCPDIHKPSKKLVVVTPINKKKIVSSMFDARHELCFLKFVSDMNASSKSKSVKKAKKKEEWKPTGKVFTKIGYNWRPTRRTFTLVGNACPLTRITATNKVPLREPIPLEVIAQESIVTKVYTRRPKVPKTNGSNSKPKIAKSLISNKTKPGTSRGSNTSVASQVVQFVLWYLDSGCFKHMTVDRSQLTNFVHKFLGTVKFDNNQIVKIMGYGDYQIRNITISIIYYVEGLGHNLFTVGQFCDSYLEVAFRKHTCFVRNLEGDHLLSGSRETNLYSLSMKDIMASSPICLLSKASKTKSWIWH